MDPLKELFESGQTILWIETQNAVAFLRPVPDILVWTPCPTAGLAESLRLCQIGLAPPHRFFRPLVVRHVGYRPDKLTVARCILYRVSDRMDVLDSLLRQQQAVLVFEMCAALRYVLDDLLYNGPILRMRATQQHAYGGFLGRVVFENPIGFV